MGIKRLKATRCINSEIKLRKEKYLNGDELTNMEQEGKGTNEKGVVVNKKMIVSGHTQPVPPCLPSTNSSL